FFSRLKLDYPVSLGEYRCPRSPQEPMVLHLVHVPTVPFEGLSARQQSRAAREKLFEMTFSGFEERVRDELTRMLGRGGFDADRDIAAITVNRWGHGYSYAEDQLFDKPAKGPMPFEVARERVGRISIENDDDAWKHIEHDAIHQSHRAAGALLSNWPDPH